MKFLMKMVYQLRDLVKPNDKSVDDILPQVTNVPPMPSVKPPRK